jgi:hypothetical protein
MSQNSRSQCLEIIKAHPGLCGEEIGARCKPGIQVNTVLKNISHIRDECGDDCIRTERVKGKNDGVEFATYYWQGIGVNTPKPNIEAKISLYRAIQATYRPNHPDIAKIDQQIENLRQKQAVSGGVGSDRAKSGE